MYYAYLIENTVTKTYYVGITNNPIERWRSHKSVANNPLRERYKYNHLYLAMQKYTVDSFSFEVIASFTDEASCQQFEIQTIEWFNQNGVSTYNVHFGGTLGCNMKNHPDYSKWKQRQSDFMINQKNDDPEAFQAWRDKLSKARQGKKPALGMKHTENTKLLCKKVSKDYWETQETFTKDAAEILKLSHREAKKVYNISTTHYYRLKKRFTSNDSK